MTGGEEELLIEICNTSSPSRPFCLASFLVGIGSSTHEKGENRRIRFHQSIDSLEKGEKRFQFARSRLEGVSETILQFTLPVNLVLHFKRGFHSMIQVTPPPSPHPQISSFKSARLSFIPLVPSMCEGDAVYPI